MAEPSTRIALVSGANKGIGFEICKQLAENGATVVLTARDEKRGVEALHKLHQFGLSHSVIFHQLDVLDSDSVSVLADFINSKFGKLDILVNNAGIAGAFVHFDKLKEAEHAAAFKRGNANWDELMTQTYDDTSHCLQTNYYGAKRLSEALIPLLQLSHSPRIVNVSSSFGKLKEIPSEWAKNILTDAENLGEEAVDGALNEFLKDFKDGKLEAKGWPTSFSAYKLSKAAMNAYTRILANKYPRFKINAVCPGFVRTDINSHMGVLPVEEGAASPVRLALLPDDGPSGLFFVRNEVSSFVD